MKDVVVIGAGKIGATVAGLLATTEDYQVTLADRSADVLDRLDANNRLRTVVVDVEDSSNLINLLNGQFAVLNAGPFYLTTGIAEAARAAGTHYLDLTEDVARARRVHPDATACPRYWRRAYRLPRRSAGRRACRCSAGRRR